MNVWKRSGNWADGYYIINNVEGHQQKTWQEASKIIEAKTERKKETGASCLWIWVIRKRRYRPQPTGRGGTDGGELPRRVNPGWILPLTQNYPTQVFANHQNYQLWSSRRNRRQSHRRQCRPRWRWLIGLRRWIGRGRWWGRRRWRKCIFCSLSSFWQERHS